MSEALRMWVEIGFNVTYLIVVWALVIAMARRQPIVTVANHRLNRLFTWMFGLLALGDTGHVGLRVLAYALGDLQTTFPLFGKPVGLVGLGALATAITVTVFYALLVFVWAERFDRPLPLGAYLLLAAGVVRLLVMAWPQNAWNSLVPPQPWSLYRNLPLMVQGLGIAYLLLREARAARDRTFTWIGVMILTSFAFYLPVILWVQRIPLLGMLMIPKTLAYVVIAILAYRRISRPKGATIGTAC